MITEHTAQSPKETDLKRTTLITRYMLSLWRNQLSLQIIWLHHAYPIQVYSMFYSHLYAPMNIVEITFLAINRNPSTLTNGSLQYHIFSPYSRRWLDVHPQTEAEWESCLPHCEECSQTPYAAQGGSGKVLWLAPGPLVFVVLAVPGISTIIEHYEQFYWYNEFLGNLNSSTPR